MDRGLKQGSAFASLFFNIFFGAIMEAMIEVRRFPAATTCVVAYKTEVPRLQDSSFNEMVNNLLHHIEAYESIISVQEAGYQVASHKMKVLDRELTTLKQPSAASASTTVAGTSGARHRNHQQQQKQPGRETTANPVPDRTDTAGDVDTTMCTREFNAG